MNIDRMFVFRSDSFAVRPRILRRGRRLAISTAWLVRILTAFSYRRDVHVDGVTQTIIITETTFWVLRTSRLIRFRDVVRLTYAFASMPTSWDSLGREHDSLESFLVGLELRSSEVVPLARFVGEGAAGDFGTWLMGDDLVDMEGTQEDDSRALVAELCERIGVGLGPAFQPLVDEAGRGWVCSRCGRSVAPKPKCLYCGGEAAPC